jgi:hypothetical protein
VKVVLLYDLFMYTKSFERKRGGAGGRMGEYQRGCKDASIVWDGRVAGFLEARSVYGVCAVTKGSREEGDRAVMKGLDLGLDDGR